MPSFSPFLLAFLPSLKEEGWVEGQTIKNWDESYGSERNSIQPSPPMPEW
jgi:hypothetical protein